MECNSLQWLYLLPSKPYAKQRNSGKFALLLILPAIRLWKGHLYESLYDKQTLQMAVVMGDRSNQSDVRADRKV